MTHLFLAKCPSMLLGHLSISQANNRCLFYLNNKTIITNKSRNMILIRLFINLIIKPPPLEVDPKPLKGKASAKCVKF